MTNSDQNAGETTGTATEKTFEELQSEANRVGMKFHPNIKKEALEKKLEEFYAEKAAIKEAAKQEAMEELRAQMEAEKQEAIAQAKAEAMLQVQNSSPKGAPEQPVKSPAQLRQEKVKAANKLVRVRVTCMDPNKKDWEGEIFTVSNSVIPTIKKYIPFNADEGWHVPQLILNVMQEKKCTVFKTVKKERGNTVREGYQVPAYNIEYLDPLTEDEFKNLAQRQTAKGNIG